MQKNTQYENEPTPCMRKYLHTHRRRNNPPQTNLNMLVRLENGELASNAKEHMSVFGMQFHTVLNNHRPVNSTVLDLIKQKPCLTTIDTPMTFRER